MAMNVEEANASAELQRGGESELWTLFHLILEVNSILTHNVIHNQSRRDVLHVVGKSFAKAVVHVNLPKTQDTLSPHIKHLINEAHLSPFWKSTTEVGMKNPWQQAVAPMPVTSRCGRLEFACSIALYVLHVFGYKTVSHEDLMRMINIPGRFPFHS
jgi:hypothetical protein